MRTMDTKATVVEKAPLRMAFLTAILSCGVTTPGRPSAARTVAPPAAEAVPGVSEVASPAGAGSRLPSLAPGPDGRLFLSWVEPGTADEHVLRFAERRPGGTWSAPVTIARGADWFLNWADFPSLAAFPDGSLAAHWLAKSGAGTYAYDIRVSRSADGGRTWGKPVTPHRDGVAAEHGFVSMAPAPDGLLGLFWLDGRNMTETNRGATALYSTTLGPDGTLTAETVLDDRVCDCCQTSAVRMENGETVVVYRDRSDKEVRDISLVRVRDGKPSASRTVAADDWQIDGCPVNGPAVASEGRRLAVAWFTGAASKTRVRLAVSTDGGDSFGPPIDVDDGSPLGRVDVLALPSGATLVSWLEKADAEAQVRIRRIDRDGRREPSLVVARSTPARASGFPRMERSGDEVVIAWTGAADPPRVHTAVLALGR